MKTKLMGALLTLLAMNAFANGPGELGNGGGVVERNGRILSFGKAGMSVRVEELNVDQIPGLRLLNDTIKQRDLYLSIEQKNKLRAAIYPLGKRKYFRINASDLDSKKRQELISKYMEALKTRIELGSLEVAAVTDPSTHETFLLPQFFQLNDEISQAALLFHEAAWLVNRKLSYKAVIDAEINFEAFLRSRAVFDFHLYEALATVFNNRLLILRAALDYDLQNRYLASSVFTAGHLFGEANLEDIYLNPYRTYRFKTLQEGFKANLLEKIESRPQAQTYKALYMLSDQIRLAPEDCFSNLSELTIREWITNQNYGMGHVREYVTELKQAKYDLAKLGTAKEAENSSPVYNFADEIQKCLSSENESKERLFDVDRTKLIFFTTFKRKLPELGSDRY